MALFMPRICHLFLHSLYYLCVLLALTSVSLETAFNLSRKGSGVLCEKFLLARGDFRLLSETEGPSGVGTTSFHSSSPPLAVKRCILSGNGGSMKRRPERRGTQRSDCLGHRERRRSPRRPLLSQISINLKNLHAGKVSDHRAPFLCFETSESREDV